jgi:hypothetical protein
MKCIMLNTKEVIRVKDGKAAEMVQSKQGSYCPKHVYKEYMRLLIRLRKEVK